ncbi:MAG: zinc-binding dehydrogenase [Streptosporangiaceae bacterium]|nr:zinc-binding dehydrogenase [Streptosporangiaceae bacterium]
MSMMAIEAREFGGPEVLTPVRFRPLCPEAGEAVIAVSVADILFLDTMIRSARARDAFPQRPPYIPGNGVAGHVAAVGGGVDPGWIGVGGPLGQAAFGIVADGGRFSAHGTPGGGFAPVSAREAEERGVAVRGIEQVQFSPGRHEELVRDALAEAAAGRLCPVIGQVFPLGRAADAHAALATRSAIGKTVLLAGL